MFDTLFAKNSALSALGAKITPGKVYTYDGKAEDLETFYPDSRGGTGFTYAKVATDAPSLTKLKRFVGAFADGSKLEFSKEELRIEVTDAGEMAHATFNGMTVPVILALAGNMYVYSVVGVGYGSLVEFEGTVVPIDPKFLPGVCMPVVELSTEATAEGAPLTAEESAKMEEVAAMGVPIVVNSIVDGMNVSTILNRGSVGTNMLYQCLFDTIDIVLKLVVAKLDGRWVYMRGNH